jgi:hypothetical protein
MDHQIEKMGIVQIMSTKKEKKKMMDDGLNLVFFVCVSLFDFHIRPRPETTTTTTATLLLIQ